MCLCLSPHGYLVLSQQEASVQIRQTQPIAAMTTAVKIVHSANLGSLKSGRTHEILGLRVHMNLANLGTSKAVSDLLTYCLSSFFFWGAHQSEQAIGSIFVAELWGVTCYLPLYFNPSSKHVHNKQTYHTVSYSILYSKLKLEEIKLQKSWHFHVGNAMFMLEAIFQHWDPPTSWPCGPPAHWVACHPSLAPFAKFQVENGHLKSSPMSSLWKFLT